MKILLNLIQIFFRKNALFLAVIVTIILGCVPINGLAAIPYQDFEPDNGTPPKFSSDTTDTPEYGWAFGSASAALTQEGYPVHSGQYSWRVAIPDAETLKSGTGIASMAQTYNMNFIPACFDRLTFWIWSEPMHPGAHTVMVKFFDHGLYHEQGIGVWTLDRAIPGQWVQLMILFSQLPEDFDFSRVDKIEFFNYWDGIYYYDDILIASPNGENEDTACLEAEGYAVCEFDPLVQQEVGAPCVSVYSGRRDLVLDYMFMQGERHVRTFHDLRDMDEALK